MEIYITSMVFIFFSFFLGYFLKRKLDCTIIDQRCKQICESEMNEFKQLQELLRIRKLI